MDLVLELPCARRIIDVFPSTLGLRIVLEIGAGINWILDVLPSFMWLWRKRVVGTAEKAGLRCWKNGRGKKSNC